MTSQVPPAQVQEDDVPTVLPTPSAASLDPGSQGTLEGLTQHCFFPAPGPGYGIKDTFTSCR